MAFMCVQELQRMEKEMGRDYRVNYRLEDACSRDVDSLCGADVCNRAKQISCGGTVLRCLVDKKEEIKAESCKQEVYYYVKMEVCSQHTAASPVVLPVYMFLFRVMTYSFFMSTMPCKWTCATKYSTVLVTAILV